MTPCETEPSTSRARPGPRHAPPERQQAERRTGRRADQRFRLLRALDHRPDLSQRGLAEATGVSLGAANARLNRLIEAGLVTIAAPGSDGARFRIGYVLTEDGRAEMERHRAPYLARRRAERAALEAEIAALEAEAGTP